MVGLLAGAGSCGGLMASGGGVVVVDGGSVGTSYIPYGQVCFPLFPVGKCGIPCSLR